MRRLFLTAATCFWSLALSAQSSEVVRPNQMDYFMPGEQATHQHPMGNPKSTTPQPPQTNPYAGTSAGLSESQRAQYLSGEGMGFAKPAEMNHYPGPRHVLQNADRVNLSDGQRAATQALFDDVQLRAKALGKKIVEREDELLHIFSSGTADEPGVTRLTAEIGSLQAELRAVHLTAHLKERRLLSSDQIRIYDQLRDYVPGEKPAPALHQH